MSGKNIMFGCFITYVYMYRSTVGSIKQLQGHELAQIHILSRCPEEVRHDLSTPKIFSSTQFWHGKRLQSKSSKLMW